MKQWKQLASLCLAALLLSGCGRADRAETIPVTEATLAAYAPLEGPTPESFQNANGTAEFHMVKQELADFTGMKVLEAQPHYLTPEDAREIVYTLFPEANCIERGAEYDKPDWYFTRESLEESLERWRSYLQGVFLAELLGTDALAVGGWDESGKEYTYIESYEQSLAYYEEVLKRLPEGDVRPACRWTMRKENEYRYPAEECARMDLRDDTDSMQAIVEVGETNYFLAMDVQKQGDRKMNQIHLSAYGGLSPMDVDTHVLRAKYRRTPEPTQAQIENAKALALQYIESFGWGSWEIAEERVDRLQGGDNPEYLISLKATPKGFFPGVDKKEVINAPEMETGAYFSFNANGFLDSFSAQFPTQEITILEDTPELLPVENLMEGAVSYLSQSRDRAFGMPEEILEAWDNTYNIKTMSVLEDVKARSGYVAQETEGEKTRLVPALVLYGHLTYQDQLGSEPGIYSTTGRYQPGEGTPILAVNALDGTIITLY